MVAQSAIVSTNLKVLDIENCKYIAAFVLKRGFEYQ